MKCLQPISGRHFIIAPARSRKWAGLLGGTRTMTSWQVILRQPTRRRGYTCLDGDLGEYCLSVLLKFLVLSCTCTFFYYVFLCSADCMRESSAFMSFYSSKSPKGKEADNWSLFGFVLHSVRRINSLFLSFYSHQASC